MKSLGHLVTSSGRMMVVAFTVLGGAVLAPSSHALVPGEAPITGMRAIAGTSSQTYPFMGGTNGIASSTDRFASRDDTLSPYSIASFVTTQLSGSALRAAGMDEDATSALIPNSFSLGSLTPVAYQLSITSLGIGIPGIDGYNRVLRATSAEARNPDPKTWAILLLAIGLIGMRLHRKSRLDNARHFA